MGVNQFISCKMIEKLGCTPTPCQERLFATLSSFVTGENDSRIMVVNGYAGTGKTSSIAALISVMNEFGYNLVLMAPTGRAAKVLSNYTLMKARTIHKQIYRQKSMREGTGIFTLDINHNRDTIYIVDEASLITVGGGENSPFGSGNLLDDLMEYVFSKENNRLILTGDSAQLPPVGMELSLALDSEFLTRYGTVTTAILTTVVRQAESSGILRNATILRRMIEKGEGGFPKFETDGFSDVDRLSGEDLIERLSDSFDKAGIDETLVLCRSNKRANRYNRGIRSAILVREERLNKGDKVMVVKNCYQFLDEGNDIDFIANGDVVEIVRIYGYENRYGLDFAEAVLRFGDYNDMEITAKIILNTLESETASLGEELQRALYQGVYEDYSDIKTKRKRLSAVREDKYFNALQIKFATAITCHKSQGGQWSRVFIDNPFWKDNVTVEDLKWLYTAMTRAVEKLYFINFDKRFFK
ncbi:MAG: AAA family ATPase [Bacteroidales bacterium]|nr:AAA family ATPase [Bacteroidales bacterium]MDD2425600.1 AAA family ATPase [Bacteroidales bacterium]MDD3989907.1 AAA family ATPase [Bacteroidales bacterium]